MEAKIRIPANNYVVIECFISKGHDPKTLKRISKDVREVVESLMKEGAGLEIKIDFIRKIEGKTEGKHGFSFAESEMNILSSEINKLPWNIRLIFSDVYEYD